MLSKSVKYNVKSVKYKLKSVKYKLKSVKLLYQTNRYSIIFLWFEKKQWNIVLYFSDFKKKQWNIMSNHENIGPKLVK